MKCPIWGTEAETIGDIDRDGECIDSPRAGGQYFISGTAIATIRNLDEESKSRLTTWLVSQRRAGVDVPEILSRRLSRAKSLPALSVVERANSILIFVNENSPSIATRFVTNNQDRSSVELLLSISESKNISEVEYLQNYLVMRGLISSEGDSKTYYQWTITPEGYAYLDSLNFSGQTSAQGFIAMWFDASLDEAFTLGFEPGIKKAGYNPFRIDGKSHNNKIDDEIVAEIRRSRFVVADFTQEDENGARGGVYYEAGFAHGLNIPVIFTCREDAIGKVHFDTRQYNHITWKKPADLVEKLAARISATIGDGPLRSLT